MSGAEIAVLITAVAVVIGSLAAMVTALTGLVVALGVLAPAVLRTKKEVGKVHEIVNSERTDAARYRAMLVELLHVKGIAVPLDPSLEP